MARDSILSQLKRMRMSFRHSLKCGIPIHKEDILHEQSISQMGKYEQYIKNNIVPLRDPDPDARPTAKPTFGNPYKVTFPNSYIFGPISYDNLSFSVENDLILTGNDIF